MRIVFMGTPHFAAQILEDLCQQHEVVGVLTRADAVSGRGKEKVPCAVKQVALAHGIPEAEPDTLRNPAVQQLLREWAPDAVVVAAYGKLLPQEVLDIPRFGCLNVHTSVLPHWRGAAPVQRAILAGDEEVGVCIMRMETGLDTGDYCICRTTEVGDKTYPEIMEELAVLGSSALLTALEMIETGTVHWTHQHDNQATYARKLSKGEMFIAPTLPAETVRRRIQASSHAHPARCVIAFRSVTVVAARRVTESYIIDKMRRLRPGRIIMFEKRLYLGCADGAVELVSIRPDGKKTMDAKAFAAGVQNVKSGLITWEALPR
jgi:methionyl-tRNA formyltransferase